MRTHDEPLEPPQPVRAEAGPIRILLVICRPQQADDVPFRSVASRLVKALTAETQALYQLDVLRPATFTALAARLRAARQAGRPYHVVHFDGHGMYAEVADRETIAQWLRKLVPLALSGPRAGSHGYLLFEDPQTEDNLQLVDGQALGRLLKETGVPVLVLNACRSAHAEAPPQPSAASADEVHAQVRAFGSLAQEVIDCGVTGVVAMRYNVYVVTAAQFVADLYAALLQGAALGEAVTLGRKQLATHPQRTIAYDPRPLCDWCVPVVYEALPTPLFPPRDARRSLAVAIAAAESTAGAGGLDPDLPPPPDAGFFGRDETLLALDRALDTQAVVLLHALAGSGKTATVAEFARWYAFTGGVQGPVLFTSFEHHTPLARVLDRIGQVFGAALEQAGVHWLALDDAARRQVALQVLQQVPVLWIWDNVEPIAGFPAARMPRRARLLDEPTLGEPSSASWPISCAAARTKARFLLTSRRDERAWLGDLPRRIEVPPMPMQERVQLARGLAEKHGRRLTDVEDWRPLLRFTGGNPLAVTVLVGQALRDKLETRDADRGVRRAVAAGRGAGGRRRGPRPQPQPGRVAAIRLRARLYRARTPASGPAAFLPGVRECGRVAGDGPSRRRLGPAGVAGSGPRVVDRALGPRGRGGPVDRARRRLLHHPPRAPLVLQGPVRRVLARRRRRQPRLGRLQSSTRSQNPTNRPS